MMKKTFLPLLFLLANVSNAQSTFQNTYGIGRGYGVEPTSDKGFIMVGSAQGSTDVISVIKTDSTGAEQWAKSYASGSNSLMASHIQPTSDGGYIIAGAIYYTVASQSDFVLMKTSFDGTLQWKKYLNFSSNDYAQHVQETSDGGFIVIGMTSSGAGMAKTKADGSLEWSRTYSGTLWGKRVKQTKDGGYVFTGLAQTPDFGPTSNNAFLVKTDTAGTVLWSKIYGGADHEEGLAVEQTPDSGYVVCGSSLSFGAGAMDAYLLKTTKNGILQWTKTYGGNQSEHAAAIILTPDGGYALAGTTLTYGHGEHDALLIKTTATGTLEWAQAFGGADAEEAYSLALAHDGGYALLGYTESSFATYSPDLYFIKTQPNDTSSCYRANALLQEGTGGAAVTGGITSTATGTLADLFIQTNFGSLANIICPFVGMGLQEIAAPGIANIFPQPFSSAAILQTNKNLDYAVLILFNAMGEKVKTEKISGNHITIHRDELPEGIYIFTIAENDQPYTTGKLVIAGNP